MADKVNEDKHPVDENQMLPLLPPTYSHTVGLDALRTIDTLKIKQIPLIAEIICGFPSQAKFDIFNERNERLFEAIETSSFWQRLCCTTRRRFTLRIVNNLNQDIVLMRREFKCCSGCCWCANAQCCKQELTVESPPGVVIGIVSQKGSCWRHTFEIKDVNDTTMFTLVGPVCICDGLLTCCCENKFTLIGTDGITEIGAIYKQYRGHLQEAFSSADAFLLKVPIDLDVKMKVVTLGAVFLIDFMLFSTAPNNNN
ncbi:unnamed protein product [Adineta ricciae]|uniref:Phospholipid scramblase n=1 Tax=Adineta ricciae TaxID=249248 RepID=A0A814TGM6_ADIRI|nr:unnamed protein product [Adineta ricciae]